MMAFQVMDSHSEKKQMQYWSIP